MSLRHVVRCDGPGCTAEAPIDVHCLDFAANGARGTPLRNLTTLTNGWRYTKNEDFCSWRCQQTAAEQNREAS